MIGPLYSAISLPDDSIVPANDETFAPQEKTIALHLLDDPVLPGNEGPTEEAPGTNVDPCESIAMLYREMRPKIYRYVNGMRIGTDASTEVVQEAFVRLMTRLVAGDVIENPGGWAMRVAHNLAIDIRKKQTQLWHESEEIEEALNSDRSDPAINQEEQYLETERMRRMREALQTFNPNHRHCFLMRVQGLRYKDIGEALHISEQRAALIVKNVAARLKVICG